MYVAPMGPRAAPYLPTTADELPALAELVREEMTTPVEKTLGLEVPLRVDVASGPNWLDVTEMPS